MILNIRPHKTVVRLGGLAVTGAAAVSLTGLTAGTAQAAPGDNLPRDCLQASQDGGETWGPVSGDDSVIDWSPRIPVPGSFFQQARFEIRNHCDTPAKAQVYAGAWDVTDGGSATVRADFGEGEDADEGETVTLHGPSTDEDYGIPLNETGTLDTDAPVQVTLWLGIPANETVQNFTITPGWALILEETEPADDGGNGTGPGDTDEPGDGSGGTSTGSLEDLLDSIDVFGSLGSPDVHTGSLGSLTGSLGSLGS